MATQGDTLYLKPSAKREHWFALTHDRRNSLFSIHLLSAEAAASAARKGISTRPLGTCADYLEDLSELLGQHREVLSLTEAEHLHIRKYCRNRHIRVSATEAKRPAAEGFQRYEDAESAADANAISSLYGKLPDWLPETVEPDIRQALSAQRNAGQSNERIVEIVSQIQADPDRLKIPGTVQDVGDFVKSASYLARVQRVLSLDKAAAIEALAGKRAAGDYQRSALGTEAQFGTPQARRARNEMIWQQAAQLRTQFPNLSENDIALRLAPQFKRSPRQIKRIIAEAKK